MDLGTLWRLAEHWYDGRLGYDYTRREPAEAKEYLRAVGLSGPFWGLRPRAAVHIRPDLALRRATPSGVQPEDA